MVTVNAMGDACPIPVVKTKNAIASLKGADVVETLVDNEIAVENLKKMADQKGYKTTSEKLEEGKYRVCIIVENVVDNVEKKDGDGGKFCDCTPEKESNKVVVIRSSVMGEGDPYQDVEVRVAEREQGVMMELWSNTLDVFSVSLISPSGEEVPRVTSGQKNWMFDFLFENTVIYVNFQTLNLFSGDQLIVVRMADPSPGIWRIRVYGERIVDGVYNIWLPVTGFVSSETVFLNSNPDITLTEPGNTETPITTGAYRSSNGSIYMDSGRGFTRNGRIKPDLAAPGVAVAAYGPENRAVNLTGTSAAAAVTAGAAALLLEWGVVRKNRLTMGTLEIKQLLVRGADRSASLLYPNRSWGYGSLNLYQAFAALGRF